MSAAFEQTLALVLPDEQETDVLRACLLTGDPARQSWDRWQAGAADPYAMLRDRRARLRPLAPLLHESLRRSGAQVRDQRFLTTLRMAMMREELRSGAVRDAVADVLAGLREAGREPFVLKGTALAEAVYPQPSLRHTHDLDLLAPVGSPGGSRYHPSGLGVHDHRHLFRSEQHRAAEAGMRERAVRSSVAGIPAFVLSGPDMLVHVCAHAFSLAGRNVARWVPDAWLLLRAGRPLDWDRVLATADEGRLALPLSVTLGYLADRLEAPVPGPVLEQLRTSARSARRAEREAALAPAWVAARAQRRVGLRTAAGRRRAGVLGRWALARAARSMARGRSPRPLVPNP
jgi:hypothetical protein